MRLAFIRRWREVSLNGATVLVRLTVRAVSGDVRGLSNLRAGDSVEVYMLHSYWWGVPSAKPRLRLDFNGRLCSEVLGFHSVQYLKNGGSTHLELFNGSCAPIFRQPLPIPPCLWCNKILYHPVILLVGYFENSTVKQSLIISALL